MPRARDDVERIGALDWPGLQTLWAEIAAGQTPAWEPGRALEYLVLRAFQLDGAAVTWPFEVDIAGEIVEQSDGAVHYEGLSCIVECKDTAVPVYVEPIAKLRNQLLRRRAGVIGLVEEGLP
jgi:hypothetical protein